MRARLGCQWSRDDNLWGVVDLLAQCFVESLFLLLVSAFVSTSEDEMLLDDDDDDADDFVSSFETQSRPFSLLLVHLKKQAKQLSWEKYPPSFTLFSSLLQTKAYENLVEFLFVMLNQLQ